MLIFKDKRCTIFENSKQILEIKNNWDTNLEYTKNIKSQLEINILKIY